MRKDTLHYYLAPNDKVLRGVNPVSIIEAVEG